MPARKLRQRGPPASRTSDSTNADNPASTSRITARRSDMARAFWVAGTGPSTRAKLLRRARRNWHDALARRLPPALTPWPHAALSRTEDILLPLIVTVLIGLGTSGVPPGSSPPPFSLSLSWTAPGDDGKVGRAQAYSLRYSTAPITESNFAIATQVSGMPAPGAAGAIEDVTVTGLEQNTTYYFALKTRDEAGNWSALSNVVRYPMVATAV